jgi:hypothetical protein
MKVWLRSKGSSLFRSFLPQKRKRTAVMTGQSSVLQVQIRRYPGLITRIRNNR